MDIRKLISDRMADLEWSNYRLVQAVKGKIPETTVYEFLAGKSEINSKYLGMILEVLGLDIIHPRRRR